MMPTIGRLSRPPGVARSTRSPILRLCSRAKLSDTITPSPALASLYMPRWIFGDERAMASTLEAGCIDGDQHDGRPADRQSKAPHGLHVLDARYRADRVAERLRKSERAIGQILRARDEQIGIQRRVQPVDNRVVAFAADAAEPDDLPEREHERRDRARRAPRRLNQAVRGERTFDRPQPLQHGPQRFREATAQRSAPAGAPQE